MPLPVLAGVLRISVAGDASGGGRWQNTWHARHIDLAGWSEAEITALHDVFEDFYVGPAHGTGLPLQAHNAVGTTVDVISYTPLDGTSGASIRVPTAAAGSVNNSVPPEVTAVLTLRTAARGRQNRGRIFLPPPTTQWVTASGRVSPDYITDVLGQITFVSDTIVSQGAELGVGSYGPYVDPAATAAWIAGGRIGVRPGPTIFTGAHFTPITTFTMDDMWDVQRSRKN